MPDSVKVVAVFIVAGVGVLDVYKRQLRVPLAFKHAHNALFQTVGNLSVSYTHLENG